jgi:biopolymer transport protein ExbD
MDEPEVDFTPLIDVTFLLLIFFMVTTTLSQPTEVKLPRATSGKGEVAENKILLHILRGDDETESVRFGLEEETAIPFVRLKDSLAAFASLDSAMIRADEEVDFAYVDRVASKLRSLGVNKIVLGVKERNFIKGDKE